MKNIWLDKSECSGCGACSNICPRKAIYMTSDQMGFIYPQINSECINCNLCEKVCKLRKNLNYIKRISNPDTYAAWSKNSAIRFNSTSGGIFSEIVSPIIENNGYVAGAQYIEDNLVEHTLISDNAGLEKIRQSKYIQSNPRNIYSEIKHLLEKGNIVAFCGAPCQVAALYAFLGKDYDDLLTIDFICRGMNSPKAYQAWLSEIEKKESKKITRVWFKYKDGGWNSSPRRTRLDFDDGNHIVLEGKNNLFMHGYLTSNLYIRPSCGKCDFKGVPRQGDITLADFWNIDKSLDDDKGTSMVLINSSKGKKMFEKVKDNIFFQKREFDEIYSGNVCFNGSVNVPENSEIFLKDLDTMTFSKAIKKYTHKPLLIRIVDKIKRR